MPAVSEMSLPVGSRSRSHFSDALPCNNCRYGTHLLSPVQEKGIVHPGGSAICLAQSCACRLLFSSRSMEATFSTRGGSHRSRGCPPTLRRSQATGWGMPEDPLELVDLLIAHVVYGVLEPQRVRLSRRVRLSVTPKGANHLCCTRKFW